MYKSVEVKTHVRVGLKCVSTNWALQHPRGRNRNHKSRIFVLRFQFRLISGRLGVSVFAHTVNHDSRETHSHRAPHASQSDPEHISCWDWHFIAVVYTRLEKTTFRHPSLYVCVPSDFSRALLLGAASRSRFNMWTCWIYRLALTLSQF